MYDGTLDQLLDLSQDIRANFFHFGHEMGPVKLIASLATQQLRLVLRPCDDVGIVVAH